MNYISLYKYCHLNTVTLLSQFQYDTDISMMVSYRSNGNFIITFATEITKRLCLNNNFVYHTSTVYHVEITITMLKQQFCINYCLLGLQLREHSNCVEMTVLAFTV